MDELIELRKKLVDLERDNRLFKETEIKLQVTIQQLQASEQELKFRQESLIRTQRMAHVGSWEWDVASDTVNWSDELFQIFRLNPKKGAVSYSDHPKIYTPESMQRLDMAVHHALETGEPYKMDLEIVRGDGTNAFCTAMAYAKKDEKGKVVSLHGSLQDISERKNAEEYLENIKWLLLPKKEKSEVRIPEYGDLTSINQQRTILDSVGKEVLNEIVSDYLSLLETSAAVYEKNGDYAVGIFSSDWCKFMDCSSRGLCKSQDNGKALESGKWLCHESCWADASKQSIQNNKAFDIECSGGLHIYAIPIRANNEVIGSINFGYGDPPTNEEKLIEIAANYHVSVDQLAKLAKTYESRPAFIIDIAKEKLETSAKLIGNMVERNQMEEDLLKNQKRYEKAQKLGHVGNWEFDPATTSFWTSDEAKRIFGFDLNLEVFSTEMVEDCIPERERVHQALLDLLEQNKKYDLVFDIITNDKGIRKTIHSIAELERDAKGNPLKVTGVISDITLQKKADDKLITLNQHLLANEQQLKASNQQITKAKEKAEESEERFRELVNTINSGVAIYEVMNDGKSGGDYIIKEFNEFALKHEQLERKDTIGKSLRDIRPNIDEYGLIDMFQKVWRTGEPAFFPAKVYVDEKYSNYYENRIFRLPSGAIVAIYDDVSDRENATAQINESQVRFDLAMKASKDGLFDWDLSTNEIYYSPGYKSMLGYEEEELPNDFTVWETLTYPKDVERSWRLQQELINKQRDRFEIEFRMKHKNGHWVDILSRAEAVFNSEGKAIRMIGTHVDISELKQTELELLKAKEK